MCKLSELRIVTSDYTLAMEYIISLLFLYKDGFGTE